MTASLPANEIRRLTTLRDYAILDTPPEQEFDDITALAAAICQAPAATITLVDETRQWFKSKVGLTVDFIPREMALCSYVILDSVLMEVPDMMKDDRFATMPLVTGNPNIRFYAGTPLISPCGQRLGTLCVVDFVPRELTDLQKHTLMILGRQVMTQMQFRRELREHRLTEEILKLNEEKMREQGALLDKAQDAIMVRDLDHRILYWNQSAERLYGWAAEEVIGRSAENLLYNDTTAFRAAAQCVLTEGEWTGELQQFTKDGTELTVEGHWTLVHDTRGRPKSILSINTDITEKKKLEQQFLRAQRMESIGTLAGGISHDLNNVLAPILMSIELLKMQETDEVKLNILTTIETSARRGADMVKQVLSFARGLEGMHVKIGVHHLVGEVEKIAHETFPKNIGLAHDFPAHLWDVEADPTQLHQVLLNLCVNARDAMPEGGTLTLSASNVVLDEQYVAMNIEAKPGPHVVIQVEDTGAGMPPQILERIFEPFFTTKELGKGTGLGLSTTLAIIKSHAGFIRVESEVGKGTSFRIYLPAQVENAVAETVPKRDELPRGNGELILVVDDEAPVRQIIQQTLETFGYRVLLASDGTEAVALYAEQKREIASILTDMMMPVMDGPTTIQVLLRMNPQARIIGASGLNANGMVAKAAGAGVKHFIPKPYTAETLLKTLRQILTEPLPGAALSSD